VNALIEMFLEYVALERGLSERTRLAYAADLASFRDALKARGVKVVNDVSRDHILDYLLAERERGLAVNSISRRLVAIKVFFSFLQREGLVARNVTSVMESPRLWKVLPGLLRPREVERLLQAVEGDDKMSVRNRAVLELFYATGMRVQEMCDLQLDDVHMDEHYIRCTGKGSKTRVVPFGSTSQAYLERYFLKARPLFEVHGPSRYVFLTIRGGAFTRKRLWQIVKACARKAGIDKNVYPHTLRHSFASHLLANGAPLRVIQEMLGHADIATTQVYTHVDQDRLRSVHHQFHPRG
jgi:integrase/recombinase XerD